GIRAIQHWTEMHEACRLCGPWYFYILLFILYELPILILAIVGTFQFLAIHSDLRRRIDGLVRRIREVELPTGTLVERITAGVRTPGVMEAKQEEFFGFSIWWMVLTMAFYAIVNEKVPWLIIPQVLPAVFVAVYRLTTRKAIIAIVSVIFLILCTWHTSFVPVDVNEPIVQVQNSEDLRGLFLQIDNSSRVAVASKNYWPLPWYYRGVMAKKLSYYGNKVSEQTLYDNDYDLVIAYDAESYSSLRGYTKRTIRINYWFSMYDNENRLLEWYFKRDGKLGSMNFDLFTRVRPTGSSSGI
ncbi:MAG: TIGR03663 family protein, partial [Methanomicrobiales archaeon]|nr:TIGR03663 family protein [Methanomicrobiales archaeon]